MIDDKLNHVFLFSVARNPGVAPLLRRGPRVGHARWPS